MLDVLLDGAAFLFVQMVHVLFRHAGQFDHAAFGGEEGGRDLAFRLAEAEVVVAGELDGRFVDSRVQQMARRDPSPDGFVLDVLQRRGD